MNQISLFDQAPLELILGFHYCFGLLIIVILNSLGHSFDFITTTTVLRPCFQLRLIFGHVSRDVLREPGNQDSRWWHHRHTLTVSHSVTSVLIPALCCVQVSSDGRVSNMLTLPCFLYTEITAPKTVSCFSPTSSERHAVVQDSLLVSSAQTNIINQDSYYLNTFKLMILLSWWFSPESFSSVSLHFFWNQLALKHV